MRSANQKCLTIAKTCHKTLEFPPFVIKRDKLCRVFQRTDEEVFVQKSSSLFLSVLTVTISVSPLNVNIFYNFFCIFLDYVLHFNFVKGFVILSDKGAIY